ncbi:hypothetical protein BV898_10527 [Hypsibius exemplaris]|uniref:Otopetrin-2 n=1 Tax=Hypsibius exemplaris TaxID=2072580 RepID=A0A1W0WJC3_HYPEX|nr:hypothetical protein BV898_10527 [Hypsibius exemplaris]
MITFRQRSPVGPHNPGDHELNSTNGQADYSDPEDGDPEDGDPEDGDPEDADAEFSFSHGEPSRDRGHRKTGPYFCDSGYYTAPREEDGYSVPVSRTTSNSLHSLENPKPPLNYERFPIKTWNDRSEVPENIPVRKSGLKAVFFPPQSNIDVDVKPFLNTSLHVLKNSRRRESKESLNWAPDLSTVRFHLPGQMEDSDMTPTSPRGQIFLPARRTAAPSKNTAAKHETYLWKNASTLYGILLTMASLCLMLSSNLTHNLNIIFSRWFDCIMMGIGIIFLQFFLYLLHHPGGRSSIKSAHLDVGEESTDKVHSRDLPHGGRNKVSIKNGFVIPQFRPAASASENVFYRGETDSGSFYLKMGALVFAIGAMIYNCLEMGVFVENRPCFDIVIGIEPCLFVLFLVLQLYFIFKSSQLYVLRYRVVFWFGTIHLVATDICIWIRILVNETLHEFVEIRMKSQNKTNEAMVDHSEDGAVAEQEMTVYAPLCVNEESIMQALLEKSATFLYPCIIEYTLITAGILFTMWTTVGKLPTPSSSPQPRIISPRTRFAVDCDHASHGLFAGIVVGVLTMVGIILFFVLIDQDADKVGYDDHVAVLMGEVMEIILNSLGLLSTGYCMFQFVNHFSYTSEERGVEKQLTDALLYICMLGVYSFCVVTLIGTFRANSVVEVLSFASASLQLVATSMQTVFIIDAGRRTVKRTFRSRGMKPGRQALTFLLFLNFALWATDVFCALRIDASPVQRDLFGAHGWAVILHITVPLMIFYRFHSTVCLVDIWKRAYKGPKSIESSSV